MFKISKLNEYNSEIINETIEFNEYINSEIPENIYLDYSIYQNNNFFKFGIDSFLLSKFFLENTTIKHNHIADFCSGTGIIGIYSYLNILHKSYYTENFSIRKTNIEDLKVDFFEIQKYFANLNYRNCLNSYNTILHNISADNIILADNCKQYTNPFTTNSKEKDIAKIATKDFLDTFFNAVKFCLKDKGELFIVHKPENLSEIIIIADRYNIELKTLQFITNSIEKQPSLFLAKFVKNGNKFLNILPIKSIN